MVFVFLYVTGFDFNYYDISRSIHVAANGIISFFVMAEQYFVVYMDHIFFIHSSIDGHLGCFYILAVVNVMNMEVHVSFLIIVLFSTKQQKLCQSRGTRELLHLRVFFATVF